MDLVSERLSYPQVYTADIKDYLSWYTDDEVMKYITGRGLTRPEAEARFKVALGINDQHPDAGLYAVRKRGSDLFVGIAKFVYKDPHEAEVGYGMLPEYWGKGYASEILDCMVKLSKKHHRVTKLIAIVNPENLNSRKVLTKKGFTFDKQVMEGNFLVEYYKLPVQSLAPIISPNKIVMNLYVSSYLRTITKPAEFFKEVDDRYSSHVVADRGIGTAFRPE